MQRHGLNVESPNPDHWLADRLARLADLEAAASQTSPANHSE
jgi:hypothetical protein